MKIIIVTTIMLLAWQLAAQQDTRLSGVVVEQNSKFKTGKVNYLSKAQVKAPGSAPQLSDATGKFTLIFADQPLGNLARIYAAKSGYEVVNKAELKKTAVMGRKTALKVVLCKEGALYENQVTYYKIAEDAAVKKYKKKVALLKEDGKEKQQLIKNLEAQFNQKITNLDQAGQLLKQQLKTSKQQAQELADKWVTVNLDDQSATYQRAFQAFLNKDIDLAIRILDSVDMEKRLAQNTEAIAKKEALINDLEKNMKKRDQQMAKDVNQVLLKAHLHVVHHDFKEAEAAYELALKYDPNNLKVLFEYAVFLEDHKHYAKSIQRHKEVLAGYRALHKKSSNQYWFELACILYDLGDLYAATYETQLAKEHYDEALKYYRMLAEKDAPKYLPYVARILNHLGALWCKTEHYEDAEKRFEEALSIQRKLVVDEKEEHVADLATTLHNWGVLLEKEHQWEAAEEYFEEALAIRRKLAKQNQKKHLGAVASTLNSWALLQKDKHAFDKAIQYYQEAIDDYRILAKDDEELYEDDLALVLFNLGVFYEDRGDLDKALIHMKESVALRRILVRENEEAYLEDLAVGVFQLGRILEDTKDRKGAQQHYEESVNAYRKLRQRNDHAYNNSMGLLCAQLGALYQLLMVEDEFYAVQEQGEKLMKEILAIVSNPPSPSDEADRLRLKLMGLEHFFSTFNKAHVNFYKKAIKIDALSALNTTEKDKATKANQAEDIVNHTERLLVDAPDDFKWNAKIRDKYIALIEAQCSILAYEKAATAAQNGLKWQKEQEITILLALSLLYQGQFKEAKRIGLELKDKTCGNQSCGKALLEQLEDFEKRGMVHKDAKKLQRLLE